MTTAMPLARLNATDITDQSGQSWGAATISYTMTTPSQIEMNIELNKKGPKEIGAALYLKFVKSKLGKVQKEKIKRRLLKLQKLVSYSKEMGQRALYESLCEEIAILVREAEMVAYDIDQWVDQTDIDKFRNIVKDKVIKWSPLEKFPRVIPRKVQTKIKALEKAKIFDEFHVLYIDYTKAPEMKTQKEKIRSKDPILFGRFSHQPNRFYFIADWVDEYCDLTFDKFVTQFRDNDPTFGVNEVTDITENRWKLIVDEVKARHQRLEQTKIDNWRELEKQEAESGTKLKDIAANNGGSYWWRRLWSRSKK